MEKSCYNCSKKCNDFLNKEVKCLKLNVIDWLSNVQYPFEYKSNLVEVQFKNDRKDIFINQDNIIINKNDIVTVESKSGIGYDIGIVTLTGDLVRLQIKSKNINLNSLYKKIYRISTQKEINIWKSLRKKENKNLLYAKSIAKNLNLNKMKICDAEYQGDGEKIIFYYTSENRIDFRKLIVELAARFHTRIEMRQIGYRQEAAKIGGIGSCGRELCCSTWLRNFKSVNTNSARYQQLSINIEKITGQCSKLKCCLNYELDEYLSSIKDFPDFNRKIYTVKGIAKCMKIDVFKKKMWFAYIKHPNTWFKIEVEKIKKILEEEKKKNKICPPLEKLSTNDIQKTELIFKDL